MHRPGLRLERNFDEVTLRQRLSQSEQAARYGYRLQFSFRAASIFQTDRSQNGISQLDPGRAPRGMRLGEVGHRSNQYDTVVPVPNRLPTPVVQIPRYSQPLPATYLVFTTT